MRISPEEVATELKAYSYQEEIYREYHFMSLKDPESAKKFLDSFLENEGRLLQLDDNEPHAKAEIIGDKVRLTDYIFQKTDIVVTKHARFSPVFLHKHDFYEIIYVYEGSCTNSIQDNVMHLLTGDLCVVPPSTTHCIEVFDDSIVLNIIIKENTFNKAITYLYNEKNPVTQFYFHTLYRKEDNNYLLFHTREDKNLRSVVNKLYAETINNLNYSMPMMLSFFGEFWTLLMRNHETDLEMYIQNKDTDISLADILVYFQKNYSSLTLDEAAKHFGFSTSYFSRLVKKHTGQNFVNLLHHLKLENARRALLETNLSMLDICELVGFDSLPYFSKAFKDEFKISPSHYRQQNK